MFPSLSTTPVFDPLKLLFKAVFKANLEIANGFADEVVRWLDAWCEDPWSDRGEIAVPE